MLAGARSVRVRATTPTDVQMQADESLLRQMILNLVENAVRHTPAGGSVHVALDADPGGPGSRSPTPAPAFPRSNASASSSASSGSMRHRRRRGLGPPIARWVAQLHRGTLTLESSGPGGSRFVAILPLR